MAVWVGISGFGRIGRKREALRCERGEGRVRIAISVVVMKVIKNNTGGKVANPTEMTKFGGIAPGGLAHQASALWLKVEVSVGVIAGGVIAGLVSAIMQSLLR